MEAAERGGVADVMRVVAEDTTDADMMADPSEVVEDDTAGDVPPVISEAKRGSERAQDAAADDLVDMLSWLDRVAEASPHEAERLIAESAERDAQLFRQLKAAMR